MKLPFLCPHYNTRLTLSDLPPRKHFFKELSEDERTTLTKKGCFNNVVLASVSQYYHDLA